MNHDCWNNQDDWTDYPSSQEVFCDCGNEVFVGKGYWSGN